ncbi:MAG: PfkB family carbohydrate kinase [Deltaproteobacteria bacterium]|nr:PfkB family carbohydrate kinase [Deltaproteobacteria bacterium]
MGTGNLVSLAVIGTIAFDSIKTPFGEERNIIGGSALHFASSASFFTDVGIVAPIGEDFDAKELDFLKERNVDLSGIKVLDGKTFRWAGKYGYDLNLAITLSTELNVLEDFEPHLPETYKYANFIFLANIDPDLQAKVIDQVKNRDAYVALDTMNFWIENKREALLDVIRRVDMIVVNEAELREISMEYNLIKGAKKLISMGPKTIVIKRGEYGVFMVNPDEVFLCPAYPLEEVFDPTGAGDTFAGGLMGYLSNVGTVSYDALKQAVILGCVMASFNVEDFGPKRMKSLTHREIKERYSSFRKCIEFGDLKL